MSDHHFCPHCGGHVKGERCELCAPDPEDRELDASEIHDVSPAADGSLLKQVTTAGEDAGPQQLATPSPLCDVHAMKERELRLGLVCYGGLNYTQTSDCIGGY